MASRAPHSSYSSRSVSPDAYPEQLYDPFMDPVEMSNLSRRSVDAQSPPQAFARTPSPSGGSLSNLAKGSYFPSSHGDGASSQYAPLPDQSRSRAQTQNTIGAGSIYSINSLNPYKTKDVHTQALVDRRAGEIAEWHIHWQTPAIMLALFAAGVAAAVGHHLFYSKLDGNPAEDQLKMIRYGTALAFFVKSTLVGTVILGYRQRIWHTFRKKAMTINAIDGLFAATEDPTSFWNWEMIRNGKLATFMAACSWLIPLASVLSPASLTSKVRTSFNLTKCENVSSLNFTHESLHDFRNENVYPGFSIAYYNTTDIEGKQEGWFDYYDQPSKNARRLTVTSAYMRKAADVPTASLDNCGQGWNCTYFINFQGPGYKCEEIANSSYPVPDDKSAPFNTGVLAPEGAYLYKASVDTNDYKSPQIDTNDRGMPKQDPPYPDSLGVIQSEPVLWVGYAINTTKPYDSSSPLAKKWKNVHEPKIFKCVAHHTNYTFNMTYMDAIQIPELKQRDFLDPVVDTTLSKDQGEGNNFTASPASNYVSPRTDKEKYKLTATYHAMGYLLRNFLRGDISYSDGGVYITKSDISETRLMEASTSYPVENLMEGVQSLYEDMIITLLSEPHLVIADKQSVACRKSRTVNVYVYYRQGLWVGYAIAVFFTFAFIVVGAWSIYQNGVASDTQFSRIMVTTRNPTIDRLSVGACLGGDPFPKELRETKLRFGVLLEDEVREGPLGKVEYCCFGAAGETKEIVKYGTYAGLKKWRKDAEEDGNMDEKQALLLEDDLPDR